MSLGGIKHISIFMPTDSTFHRRLFGFLAKAFKKQGLQVSGACQLLNGSEMMAWIGEKKPCAVFEMNRVKDEIPVLHELGVIHISWVVDMQGRGEAQIKGSDITYTFDPGWVDTFDTGGLLKWMPPGTCPETFFPSNRYREPQVEFGFIGHIPKPWSGVELSRPVGSKDHFVSFEVILKRYSEYMQAHTYQEQTHDSCASIIDKIVRELLGQAYVLSQEMYYDLLVRIKRMNNRTNLIDYALRYSDSIAIYGSENWQIWPEYKRFYRYFIDESSDINIIHQQAKFNLHDGVGFHFRSIDCMASGGLLLWYGDNNDYEPGELVYTRGLADFFLAQYHYYEFKWMNFDEVYERAKQIQYQGSPAQQEVLDIIRAHHTWDKRARQVIADIAEL